MVGEVWRVVGGEVAGLDLEALMARRREAACSLACVA